jgi:hypothetical protein
MILVELIELIAEKFWVKNLQDKNHPQTDGDRLCENKPKLFH